MFARSLLRAAPVETNALIITAGSVHLHTLLACSASAWWGGATTRASGDGSCRGLLSVTFGLRAYPQLDKLAIRAAGSAALERSHVQTSQIKGGDG